MRKVISSIAAAGVVAAVAAPAAGSGPTVKVDDYKFVAKTIRIKKGTTVTWKWVGGDPHNVTFAGFRSKTRSKGAYRHTFRRAGTFKYVCTIHNKSFAMHGTVIVR